MGVGVVESLHCGDVLFVWGAKIIDLGVWCKYFVSSELLFNIPKLSTRPQGIQ
jgi:hypothetical protein